MEYVDGLWPPIHADRTLGTDEAMRPAYAICGRNVRAAL